MAGTGFDWLVIDAEHTPNGPSSVLAQLQAASAYPVSMLVRPMGHDPALIKQYLDAGAQSAVGGDDQAGAVAGLLGDQFDDAVVAGPGRGDRTDARDGRHVTGGALDHEDHLQRPRMIRKTDILGSREE